MRLLTIVVALGVTAGACKSDEPVESSSDAGADVSLRDTHGADDASNTNPDARARDASPDVASDAAPQPDAAAPDLATADLGTPNTCGESPGQLLWPAAPWNSRVDQMATATDSAAVIAYLQANQQTAATFQIDFSIKVLTADAATPKMAFDPTGDHFSPDCDTAPIPIPGGGELEGENGYACEGGGDCHLIVYSPAECRLYEMWRANIVGNQFDGGCLAVWETDRAYTETLRGDYCTSADAAGLPIAPLLVTSDEVFAGQIEHALRYILPNSRIRDDVFVRPGTHSTGATSGPAAAPPYAGLLRLRADVDLSGLTPAQQTVGRALQQYGMYLADGGNLTFTMASDRFSEHTWDEVGFDAQDMKWLEWTDFELVDTGPRITWSTGDCNRTPLDN